MKVAAVPSDEPEVLSPAKVETTPEGLIFLIRVSSVTYVFPNASTAIPLSALKDAAVPIPSAEVWSSLPAKVVTKPTGLNFCI